MLQEGAPKEQRSSSTLHAKSLRKWHKARNIKSLTGGHTDFMVGIKFFR